MTSYGAFPKENQIQMNLHFQFVFDITKDYIVGFQRSTSLGISHRVSSSAEKVWLIENVQSVEFETHLQFGFNAAKYMINAGKVTGSIAKQNNAWSGRMHALIHFRIPKTAINAINAVYAINAINSFSYGFYVQALRYFLSEHNRLNLSYANKEDARKFRSLHFIFGVESVD